MQKVFSEHPPRQVFARTFLRPGAEVHSPPIRLDEGVTHVRVDGTILGGSGDFRVGVRLDPECYSNGSYGVLSFQAPGRARSEIQPVRGRAVRLMMDEQGGGRPIVGVITLTQIREYYEMPKSKARIEGPVPAARFEEARRFAMAEFEHWNAVHVTDCDRFIRVPGRARTLGLEIETSACYDPMLRLAIGGGFRDCESAARNLGSFDLPDSGVTRLVVHGFEDEWLHLRSYCCEEETVVKVAVYALRSDPGGEDPRDPEASAVPR